MVGNGWWPRIYQENFCAAFEQGVKRADACWHRRAGKDLTALNVTISEAIEKRPGLYYHLFPTGRQGRKVIWEGQDKAGRPYMSYWPEGFILRKREDEMLLEIKNFHGTSKWQVAGTDKESIDRLVGSNPVGIVFSEWSLHEQRAWDLLRPILTENGGWAAFLYTPRGRNHAYRQHLMAKKNKDWYSELLDVDMTSAITQAAIQAERDAGMTEEMIQQEFYCSFNAPQLGAYYGREMMDARKEGRIREFAPDLSLPVHSAWDFGYDDATSIWLFQAIHREVRLIHYFEDSGQAIAYYIRHLQKVQQEQKLIYGKHFAPHDVEHGNIQTGKTLKRTAADLGFKFTTIECTENVLHDIETCRQLIPRCYFREPDTDDGVSHLEGYRKEWDEKREVFREHPRHDQHSHGADSFRTLAMALKLGKLKAEDNSSISDEQIRELDDLYRGM